MRNSGKYYKPLWEFIANILDDSNEISLSTAIIPKERFDAEFQALKGHLLDDLGGPASFQFQQVAPLLDAIERANTPHRVFRKSVWVNKDKIAEILDQLVVLVPRDVWIEIEEPTADVPEPTPKQESGSPLIVVLGAFLLLAILAFLYVNITGGTKREQDVCIMLAIMGILGVLFRFGIIKEKWVDGAGLVIFAVMCIGGPMFAIYFVGNFFGWW